LEPSVTEVLYAVGAGSKIVADDLYSDYPADAKTKIHVNGLGPSREMVEGLQPDLIVLFDQTFTVQKANEWSATYGAPVYVTNAGTYRGVEDDIRRLGILVGDRESTSSVLWQMDKAYVTVTKAVAGQQKPKVFVVVWNNPLMTAGRGTFISNLINIAGGQDVADKDVAGYPTYSPERLVADDPDIIFTGNIKNSVNPGQVSGLSALSLRAVKDGQCFAIPDDWTARPGPRLADGLLCIAKILHPTRFKSSKAN